MRTLKQTIGAVLLFCATGISGHEILVNIRPGSKSAGLKPNLYYLYHNLQEHLFDPLRLEVTPQQASAIVKLIAEHASLSAAHLIVVPRYRGEADLRISFRLMQAKDEIILTLVTNYNAESDKVVSSLSGNELATMFYWRPPVFVYYKDEYSHEAEKSHAGNPLGLANFYILDGVSTNDDKVVALLGEVEKGPGYTPLEKFVARLTRGQFCLAQGDIECARKIESSAEKDLTRVPKPESDVGTRILEIFRREILVTDSLRK